MAKSVKTIGKTLIGVIIIAFVNQARNILPHIKSHLKVYSNCPIIINIPYINEMIGEYKLEKDVI